MPLLASDAAFDAGVSAGRTYGVLFWALILAFFAVRRARRMKDPGANRRGHLAALLLYGTWSGSIICSVLMGAGHAGAAALAVVVGLAALGCLFIGSLLAIRALLEIRSQPLVYTSGRGPAIGALVSAGIYSTIFAFGMWFSLRPSERVADLPPVTQAAPAASIERPELNFRIQPPGRPWVEMDVKKFNPDASVAFARTGPEMYFQVIAEKIPFEMAPEAAVETWKPGHTSSVTQQPPSRSRRSSTRTRCPARAR